MSQTRILFQELVATCVLGTRSRSFNLPQPRTTDGATINALRQLERAAALGAETEGKKIAATQEELMLDQLALISTALRAIGSQPSQAEEERLSQVNLEPCRPEHLPEAPAAALSMLNQLIDDLSPVGQIFLARWFDLCREGGYRLSRHSIPRLLEKLKDKEALREKLLTCGGEALPWLVKVNPDWHMYFAPRKAEAAELIKLFEEGSPTERLESLKLLRSLDANLARETLAASWASETVESRVTFLKALEPFLSITDEEFLSGVALKDKRKEVRELACDFLTRICGSALQKRLQDFLGEQVQLKGGKLEITLADEGNAAALDETMKDLPLSGLTNTFDSNMGAGARRLLILISRVAPSFWSSLAPPPKIVELILANDEWSDVLTRGLLESLAMFAATGEKEPEQARELRRFQEELVNHASDKLTETSAGLRFLKTLPADLAEALILSRLPRWAKPGS
ncbi:MAG TPA: DUF5691 domain-containing protein, partial [Candidatus Obscuribacter sp.]|nr:DUF5691 domain-containing protein [Candidatus Obscuribacter sp.]